jgi:hypothetical protein
MPASRIDTWTAEARALGVEHAQNAADWAFDGNSDQAERARVLGMMRDGDPAAWDYLPAQPDLSGQWADDLTPDALFERVTGHRPYDPMSGIVDQLADAYEDGVSDTFGLACEAALIEFCGRVAGMPDTYRERPMFGGQL